MRIYASLTSSTCVGLGLSTDKTLNPCNFYTWSSNKAKFNVLEIPSIANIRTSRKIINLITINIHNQCL